MKVSRPLKATYSLLGTDSASTVQRRMSVSPVEGPCGLLKMHSGGTDSLGNRGCPYLGDSTTPSSLMEERTAGTDSAWTFLHSGPPERL